MNTQYHLIRFHQRRNEYYSSILGIAGIAVLGCAYPLYNRTLKKEREKIAPEILKLTDELMK